MAGEMTCLQTAPQSKPSCETYPASHGKTSPVPYVSLPDDWSQSSITELLNSHRPIFSVKTGAGPLKTEAGDA